MKFQLRLFIVIIAIIPILFTACVQQEFDNPVPVAQDPVVSGTRVTIDSLKKWFDNAAPKQITAEIYVVGTVIADDKSGNFYKELVLQDDSAGISILLDRSGYYADFPIGRRVFIKCKGLYISDYNDLIQLGGYVESDGSLGRIPSLLISNYVIKGSYYYTVTPLVLKPTDLTAANYMHYVNRLVTIDDAEFDTFDTTYANGTLKLDRNLTIHTCNDGNITLRSSGYADFANTNVPDGNGKITAVLQVYNSNSTWALTDMQIKIRNTDDIQFSDPRCNSIGPCTIDTSGTYVNLNVVRCLWSAGFTGGLIGKKIRGTVISDRTNGNINSLNAALQDATGGIVVRFSAAHSFNLNDSIEVSIGGVPLTEFSGLLEFYPTPNANATILGTNTPSVRVATIDQVNTNFELWESTLVKIQNATITGTPATFSGSKTLSDATGQIVLYTASGASFASNNFPTGTVTITGIVVPFNTTKQISIRNLSDIQ